MKTKSNRIEDIVFYIHGELKNKYSETEIKAFVNILFKEYAGLGSAHVLAMGGDTVNESELLNIVLATQRLKKYEPIQYITGHTEFCGMDIQLSSDVLIPRPETEELSLQIIKDCTQTAGQNGKTPLQIIDLCTGSGCIALALSKHIPFSRVFGVDVSQNAIATARKNNSRLGLDVRFVLFDLLQTDFNSLQQHIETAEFDIIVSNPPYVTEKEKQSMQPNVLEYEPHLALFVKDNNPLVFYSQIELFARRYLKNKGRIYLEANSGLINQTADLFSDKEYIKEIRTDIFGRERFIFLQKTS
ncbi:MAG: peptide chain release factor N(5)-glutamine methyltransferase [Bacteroidales bacterium]|nr:peptide chain release factor N(5)-glutamine methyltransferase [Bacteroidales bacterium]